MLFRILLFFKSKFENKNEDEKENEDEDDSEGENENESEGENESGSESESDSLNTRVRALHSDPTLRNLVDDPREARKKKRNGKKASKRPLADSHTGKKAEKGRKRSTSPDHSDDDESREKKKARLGSTQIQSEVDLDPLNISVANTREVWLAIGVDLGEDFGFKYDDGSVTTFKKPQHAMRFLRSLLERMNGPWNDLNDNQKEKIREAFRKLFMYTPSDEIIQAAFSDPCVSYKGDIFHTWPNRGVDHRHRQ